jgi:hypothetical protein
MRRTLSKFLVLASCPVEFPRVREGPYSRVPDRPATGIGLAKPDRLGHLCTLRDRDRLARGLFHAERAKVVAEINALSTERLAADTAIEQAFDTPLSLLEKALALANGMTPC